MTIQPQDTIYLKILEQTIALLKELGKSDDISRLLFSISNDIVAPSIIYDFFMELALMADPVEEEGLGCYSLAHIEKALKEYKITGTTHLLEKGR